MSWQINLFAHPDDLAVVEDLITSSLGSFGVVLRDRGTMTQMNPVRLPNLNGLLSRKVYLVPEWAPRLVLEPTNVVDQFYIDTDRNPLVEYILPKYDLSKNIATAGRLFWSFKPSLRMEYLRQIKLLFDRLRRKSVNVPPGTGWRAFAAAKEQAREFVFNEGFSPRASPFKLTH